MVTVPKPRLHRIPADCLGGYSFLRVDAYGEKRKYMVRRDLNHPTWGWNVYVISAEDRYRWTLIIDQMSSLDRGVRVAVGHSLSRGLDFVSAADVEWAQKTR